MRTFFGLFFLLCSFAAGAAGAEPIEGKRGPAEILAEASLDQWRTIDPAQLMIIDLERGRVTIELSDSFAQGNVAQMKTLVKAGFYDGLSFYRVIDGFVAQAGDVFEKRELPEGAVRGLTAEFDEHLTLLDGISLQPDRDLYIGADENAGYWNGMPIGYSKSEQRVWALHCTGAIAMARDTPKNTGGTEIYITLQPQRYLDRNLTVFGRVIDGMQHLQALTRQAPPETEDEPLGDTILRAWMGDMPPQDEAAPAWQVFRTDTPIFADYVESRRNRPEAFFYHRSDHIDVCQLPIPVRALAIE